VATVLGVPESADEPIVDMLVQSLEHRQGLLLLDNCEHLVDEVANLAERFLRECSNVRMLATSREPLRIQGEVSWHVPSLRFPDPRGSSTLDDLGR
jgi:predicted ATPase